MIKLTASMTTIALLTAGALYWKNPVYSSDVYRTGQIIPDAVFCAPDFASKTIDAGGSEEVYQVRVKTAVEGGWCFETVGQDPKEGALVNIENHVFGPAKVYIVGADNKITEMVMMP